MTPMTSKYRMRFAFFVVTNLLLCLLFCACEKRRREFRIGVSQCCSDAWRDRMNEEIRRETTFYPEHIVLDFRQANRNNQRQIIQIDSLVNSGIDLLIVSPNEAKALTPVIERTYKKGIPIVVVDRRTNSESYTAFIATDNIHIGKDAASFVSGFLPEGGTAVEFTGSMESTAATERHKGFVNGLDKNQKVRLLASVEAEWEGLQVEKQLDSLLAAGVKPDVFFAHNDRIAVKISYALRRRGLKLPVIGVDGLDTKGGGLECVDNGLLLATFTNPPGGDRALQTAMKILKGEEFQREQLLPPALVSQETARVFYLQSEQIRQKENRIDYLEDELNTILRQYSMRNLLLTAVTVILILLVLILFSTLRYYYLTRRRNKVLAQQKKKIEAQRDNLANLSRQLEESTRSKLTFFTEVSHDLRTPLTLILAPIEELSAESSLSPRDRDLIRTIKANANTLQRLVSQTLDFRRFEEGKLRTTLSAVYPLKALDNWVAPFREFARKKMIRLQMHPLGEDKEDELLTRPCMLDYGKTESVVLQSIGKRLSFYA